MKLFTEDDVNCLLEIMAHRRDVRGHHFTDEPVSAQEIELILKAAHYAPSVGYSQPWKFVTITDDALQRKVYKNFKKAHKKSCKNFKHKPIYSTLKLDAIRETHTHIAVFYHHQGGAILGQTHQKDTGKYSVVAAIQNMWLAARALNIGIGWVSILDTKKIRKLLGLGEAYELVGYLCIGKVSKFLKEPELKYKQWEQPKKTSATVLHLDGTAQYGDTSPVKPIIGSKDFINALVGKKATFLLSLTNTQTAEIPGITQAGIPGLIHLTPTLDAEFVTCGKLKTLKKIPKTKKGIPTPAVMTRAVHLLTPFGHIESLDLGLRVPPKLKRKKMHRFHLSPSRKISKCAGIPAREVFEKGLAFGKQYHCKDDYLILAESVPSGTTTATATALALGYDAKDLFSSSFKEVPDHIRRKTIDRALAQVKNKHDIFDILGSVSDNMLIFNAGFVLGVQGRFPVVLAGGTQMACVLLVINAILKKTDWGTTYEPPRNVALCTTKWVAKDKHSDIISLLKMVDFPIDAYYADFDFSGTVYTALKQYDKGEAKEGVGAGAALIYGFLHGLGKETITRQVEGFLG